MKTSAKLALTALLAIACSDAGAQLFKCTDAAGKTTYTSTKCSDLGLKDAGEVKDRVQVTPSYQPPARPTPALRDQEEPRAKPSAAAEPEKKPERRCFTTNVKGKSVTRCNDKPDED